MIVTWKKDDSASTCACAVILFPEYLLTMLLSDFHPQPMLVTRASTVAQPRFPVIDAHNHLGELFGGGWDQRPVRELLDVLDEANVRALVDLDGGWGQALLEQHLDHFKAAAPE